MVSLTPDIAPDILAACQTNASEVSAALTRALDAPIAVEFGELTHFAPDSFAAAPGLCVLLKVGKEAALFLIPEAGGILPSWYTAPDPTGQSKLTTLAQELGMLVLPESLMPEDFQAARVSSLAGALKRGGIAGSAGMLPIRLSQESRMVTAHLIWPAATPSAVLEPAAPVTPAEPKPARPMRAPVATAKSLEELPNYTRSLLKIRVPVMVTLASKKQKLGQILDLGPGSIIQFDKSCDEMLDLEASGHRMAQGEAVKVGDKFGLRITSVVLPEERFKPVR